MKILALTAENIKRLSVVEITPDGSSVVVLAGENEAGKSSVLDAIEMALGGEKKLPAEPMRRGAEKAKVVLDLGDLVVTRRFTKFGTSLTVTNRDGAKYPSPQALIDGLVGRLTFDPLAFATMKADQQAVTLRALAKIDTSDLEEARLKAYEERTHVNRDVTRDAAALATTPHHPDAGTTLETFDALTAKLEAADGLANAAAAADRRFAAALEASKAAIARARQASETVEDLRRRLADAEAEEERLQMAASVAEDAAIAAATARDQAAALVPDRTALRAQIASIEAKNRLVLDNQQRSKLEQQLADKRAEAERLTTRIAQLDTEKAERLASAAFPVKGLGLDDTGVTWNGLPFAQASTAVRTRVSVAIGLALNPKLKILLVRNGNDLGAKNLQLIAELAAQAGAQVWIERIDGAKGFPTVVIEDGTVLKEAVNA